MESGDVLARLSILRAEKENGNSDVASILGPALAWERSADTPDLLAQEMLLWKERGIVVVCYPSFEKVVW